MRSVSRCSSKVPLAVAGAALLLLVSACDRRTLDLDYRVVEVPIEITQSTEVASIRCLYLAGDTLYLAGGAQGGEGFVMRTTDDAQTFEYIRKHHARAVFSMCRFRGRWYFGTDSTELWYSDSLPQMQKHWWDRADWVNDLNKQPIRRFSVRDTTLLAVAGGGLGAGVLYRTHDGRRWHPIEYENECRAVVQTADVALAGGVGVLVRATDPMGTWERVALDNTFISDFLPMADGTIAALTYLGEVLVSDDQGASWTSRYNPVKTRYANRLLSDASGTWWMACNDGWLGRSKDDGETWSWMRLEERVDLLDAVIWQDELLLSATEGKIVRVAL